VRRTLIHAPLVVLFLVWSPAHLPFPAVASATLTAQTRASTIAAPPEFANIRESIQQMVEDGQTPSMAVGVMKEGQLVWAEGFGLADRERKILATPDSIYWLASMAKPLTGTGLMQLVEQGLIDLDKPANHYLGASKLKAYVGSANDMTVRRLANHSSGLAGHFNCFYGISPPPMDETIRRYGFAPMEPGAQVQYSNLGFGLLGFIVERAARMPWRQYQETRVYDLLKMTRTSDRIRPGFERDEAVSYYADLAGEWLKMPRPDFDHPPASAIFSSVNDLARFVRMHLNGGELDGVRVLKPESVHEMQRVTGESSPGLGYGVAWNINRAGSRESISHGGAMLGVSTFLKIYPQERAATILLTNGADYSIVTSLTEKLEQILFPGTPPSLAARQGPSPRPAPPAPSQALAGTWTGKLAHYNGDIPLRVTVKSDGGVAVAYAKAPARALRDPVLTDTNLTGHHLGMLQTAYNLTTELFFNLKLRDGKLQGICIAALPNYFNLPHWVELERVK